MTNEDEWIGRLRQTLSGDAVATTPMFLRCLDHISLAAVQSAAMTDRERRQVAHMVVIALDNAPDLRVSSTIWPTDVRTPTAEFLEKLHDLETMLLPHLPHWRKVRQCRGEEKP